MRFQEFEDGNPMKPNRQDVKSEAPEATDAHERGRDYLGEAGLDRSLSAARHGRHGGRDHLSMFRHGLRGSEAIAPRRTGFDLEPARVRFGRPKNGLGVAQPLAGDETRAIRRRIAGCQDGLPRHFGSEHGRSPARAAEDHIAARAGARVGFGRVPLLMLRHSCGFALANRGHDLHLIQDYPGHRAPRQTAHDNHTTVERSEGPGKGMAS